jgi:hypothetical protein
MGSVLLDTTVLIDVLRGRPTTISRLRQLRVAGDMVHVCAVNVEETIRGMRAGEEAATRALIEGMIVAPLDSPQGWQAGRWRGEFAARGTTLEQADCLVAAAAVGIGARLATGNPKDFPFPELVVEHWPVGA